MTPVFRFAPSPNGELHLGHAYSALLNAKTAKAAGGRFLLRIEDIDTMRCSREHEAAIYRDLEWLGLEWETPVRRQSEHFGDYRRLLDELVRLDLVYPAFMSRGEIRAHIADAQTGGRHWPRDPDGAPFYPPHDKALSKRARRRRIERGDAFAWRLDMEAALSGVAARLFWVEGNSRDLENVTRIEADAGAWGDVVIARKDIPTSYHLSVVADDALQGITHIVRGRDLYFATAVQRLLQELLGFSAPVYFHHELIAASDGRKLSKSARDNGIAALRESGMSAGDVRKLAGLG